ncbi:LytR/AlgR family response regulator transcription factor [Christiangramia portivictoriae]|uniref:LytR/AlgR family response regulator transcription factor n=1 Tax=Christiangramia portivictoriae TaxID=326069 RepID=UPI0003F8556F|nr:response regulator transcription factor [Christiangramia portivictoriae]
MNRQAKIIIVENNIPMAAKLSLKLNKLGYQITGIFSRAKDALSFVEQDAPDLILMEDHLKSELNGFASNKSEMNHSVLFFSGSKTKSLQNLIYQKLKNRKHLIKRAIPERLVKLPETADTKNYHLILKDRIFVRYQDAMVKIALDDIHYIEADRNYCRVYSRNRKFLLVCCLKEVSSKITDKRFLRIHRSYIANLSHIDEIGSNHVLIASKSLPISKNTRTELFHHLQII